MISGVLETTKMAEDDMFEYAWAKNENLIKLLETLNKLGNDGWEAVNFQAMNIKDHGDFVVVLLKRRKPEYLEQQHDIVTEMINRH